MFYQLYAESLARFQGGSPYIYPLYGLGELPQVFFFFCTLLYLVGATILAFWTIVSKFSLIFLGSGICTT